MPKPTNSRPHLYMPDGSLRPMAPGMVPEQNLAWIDKTITFGEPGQQVSFSPEQVLLAAARMLRDGMSLAAIFKELDLDPREVTMAQLERAIVNVGTPRLEALIASGKEPAESQIQVDVFDLPLNINEREN